MEFSEAHLVPLSFLPSLQEHISDIAQLQGKYHT